MTTGRVQRQELYAIVLTVCGFITVGATLGADPQSNRTTWDGVYSEAQAMRGAAAYARVCAQCHGPALTGAEGPPLTGPEFMGNWNSLALADLFERVRTSMPPDDPSRLSTQEKVDVLAHVLAVNKFPAGSSDLMREGLTQIKLLAVRP